MVNQETQELDRLDVTLEALLNERERVETKTDAARLLARLNRVIEKCCDSIKRKYFLSVSDRSDPVASELYYSHPAAHSLKSTLKRAQAVKKSNDSSSFHPFADAVIGLIDKVFPAAEMLVALKKEIAARPKQPKVKSPLPKALQSNHHAEATYKTLRAAIEPQRAGYTANIFRHLRQSVDSLLKSLAEAGGDANKAAPYPSSSTMTRAAHHAMVNRYNEMRYWTKGDVKRPNEPEMREPIPDEQINAILYQKANQITEADFSSYAAKLTGKILADFDKSCKVEVTEAQVRGALWSSSTLSVSVSGSNDNVGSFTTSQVWATKMILNRSVLNNWFNQWPTRRVS